MSQNKSFFILTTVLALILVLVAAVFYTSKSEDDSSYLSRGRVRSVRVPPPNPALEALKEQEFLDVEPAGGGANLPAQESATAGPVTAAPFMPSRVSAPGTWAVQAGQIPAENPAAMPNYQAYEAPSLYAQADQSMRAGGVTAATYPAGNGSPATAQRGYAMGGSFASAGAEQVREKKAQDIFSPYMAALTKEEADKLEKTLDGLSDRIEEAVLRSLLPKSKKDSNIEKYLSRSSSAGKETAGNTTPASDGQFAQVAKQLSRQKAGIMRSMQQAFGDKAAGQAGQIMDSFQQELMSTLNQQDLTPEQLQQKTRQISKKYNDKLQKLSNEKGKERMQENLEKRDKDLLTHYQKSYDEKTAAALAGIMEKYRARELELAQAGLPREEYFEKALALYRERDAAMRKYLTDNHQSLAPYINAPRAEQKENPDEPPVAYHTSETELQTRQKDIAERSGALLQEAKRIYGEEKAGVFADIYQRYANEMNEIWSDPETTLDEKNKKSQEALKRNNTATTHAQLELDKDKYIQTILDNPAMANLPQDQRDAFERRAQSVLNQMNERIETILGNPNLSETQRDQQIQEARQVAQRQLFGQ